MMNWNREPILRNHHNIVTGRSNLRVCHQIAVMTKATSKVKAE
jgi:hypothetical protein